jgi:hypothetical protein
MTHKHDLHLSTQCLEPVVRGDEIKQVRSTSIHEGEDQVENYEALRMW